MTRTDEILTRITASSDRLELSVFFGHSYAIAKQSWVCHLEYKHNGVEVKSSGRASTFHEALEEAWGRLDKVAVTGLGPNALAGALIYDPEPLIDSEIPF